VSKPILMGFVEALVVAWSSHPALVESQCNSSKRSWHSAHVGGIVTTVRYSSDGGALSQALHFAVGFSPLPHCILV